VAAYASWNGATEVRAWQLLASKDADSLEPVASVSSQGFESVLRTDARGPHFAVRALDSHGFVLGQSDGATLAATVSS
jgi:hypothetical protein